MAEKNIWVLGLISLLLLLNLLSRADLRMPRRGRRKFILLVSHWSIFLDRNLGGAVIDQGVSCEPQTPLNPSDSCNKQQSFFYPKKEAAKGMGLLPS